MSTKYIRFALVLGVCSPVNADNDQSAVNPVLPLANPVLRDETFNWKLALSQSMRFLFMEHGFPLVMQPQTRSRLGGPFFSDYADSVKALRGWGDGDNWFINTSVIPCKVP